MNEEGLGYISTQPLLASFTEDRDFAYMWVRQKYWICVFVVYTYAPTVVQTLSKCSKIDVCRCSTDEGTIDLRSLARTGNDAPR